MQHEPVKVFFSFILQVFCYELFFCSIAGLCKDYCGVLNEESIRLNFVLVYELLDEVLVSLCLTMDHS